MALVPFIGNIWAIPSSESVSVVATHKCQPHRLCNHEQVMVRQQEQKWRQSACGVAQETTADLTVTPKARQPALQAGCIRHKPTPRAANLGSKQGDICRAKAPPQMSLPLIDRDRNAQVSRGNRCFFRARAFVLAVEQILQLFLEIPRFSVFFRSFERIHGWSIKPSESFQQN